MPQRMVRNQIYDGLRILLAAGGPLSAVVLRYTDMNSDDFQMFAQLALLIIPPVGSWLWGFYLNSVKNKVETIAELSGPVQQAALNHVSDAAKVMIAKGVPGVATVVVSDTANGALEALAKSPSHPNIVTETQNELDAKAGKRTVPELTAAIDNPKVKS